MQARVTGTEVRSLTTEWDLGGRGLVFTLIKSKIWSRDRFQARRAEEAQSRPSMG